MSALTRKRSLLAAATVALLASASAANAGGNGNSGNSGNSGNGGGGGTTIVNTPVTVPTCSTTNVLPTAFSCYGFVGGNVLGAAPADIAIQTTALNTLGLAGAPVQIEHLNTTATNPVYNFATPLYGATYVGIHWGAGAGGPGVGVPGGVTGFYRFNLAADANLDFITSAFGAANSGAVLFSTQAAPPPPPPPPPGGVPEPATWAMMIIGFGAAGSMIRRRRGVALSA
jgi:PEP-CTERM motif